MAGVLFAFTYAGSLLAGVTASRRHVLIIWGGTDHVYGQYLFTVQNDEEKSVHAELPVMLAKEKKDWFPQEGVLPKDVKLGEGGAADIVITQEFKPGDTFIVFNFSAPANFGKSELTFVAPYDIEDLLIMTPAGPEALAISSEDMEFQANQKFAGKPYDMLQTTEIMAEQELRIQVAGVAEGRSRFWWIGGIFGGLMLITAAIFGWRSKPTSANDEVFVVGTAG